MRGDRLAPGRDEHRLEEHDRRGEQGEHAQANQERPLRRRQLAALPAVQPPEQAEQQRARPTISTTAAVAPGSDANSRCESPPVTTPGDDGSIPNSICQIRFMAFDSIEEGVSVSGRPRLRISTRRSAKRAVRPPGRARPRGRSRRRDRSRPRAATAISISSGSNIDFKSAAADPLELAFARVGIGRVQILLRAQANPRPRRDGTHPAGACRGQ